MKSKNIIKRLTLLLTFAVVLTALMSVNVFAGYSSTVNLANVIQNEKGNGYYWDNPARVLTLDGFSLETSEDFGLKLPENATVKLVGTNRIKASKYALSSAGSITFIGSGTLIIESEGIGIYSYSNNPSHKIRLNGGKLKVSGDECAILSENAELSVTSGTLEAVGGIIGRTVSFTGGKVISNGKIHASHLLKINHASLEASVSEGNALVIDNLFETEYIKLMCGESSDELKECSSYEGGRYAVATPTSKGSRTSILFGDGVSIAVDYVLLALAVILFAAVIIIPILMKKRKTKKLYAELEAARKK